MPAPTHAKLRKAVVETARAMNAVGINQGTSGNVSARSADGFLITPSGIDYASIRATQVVGMGLDGRYAGTWAPSSEWRMHRDIYQDRPDAGAVVHTHSTYATALACAREEVPAFHYMIAVAGGASLRCADYATFGTQALSEAMLRALEGRRACLLANHGMICFGADLAAALELAVEVEVLCKQYAIACQTGRPVLLDAAQMDAVHERFRSYGAQPRSEAGGAESGPTTARREAP